MLESYGWHSFRYDLDIISILIHKINFHFPGTTHIASNSWNWKAALPKSLSGLV